MADSNITVKPLSPSYVEAAVKCIQDAFAQDPYYLWVFPDRSRFNRERNQASLRSRCYWGMRYGIFHIATAQVGARSTDTKEDPKQPQEELVGVSCWLPPSVAKPAPSSPSRVAYVLSWFSPSAWLAHWREQVPLWHLWFAQLITNIRHFGRGGLSVARYYKWKQAQAEVQDELWVDPEGYYFCNIVTVKQGYQGKGIGKRLMDEVLTVADKEGRKCYLESSRSVPNVQIYEKMGFELVRQMQCKEDETDPGITLYCMSRAPIKE